MLFSKRKLKVLRLCLVSPTLEKLLLLSYICLFPISIYIATYQTQYTSPQNYDIDLYNARKNAREYFFPESNSGFVFEGYSKNYTWVYDYLDKTLHDKLWVKDQYQPYTPIGSLRMVQFRVKNKCEDPDDFYADIDNQTSLLNSTEVTQGKPLIKEECKDLECFKKRMSPECNTVYRFGETDAYKYVMRKANMSTCAVKPKCSEFFYGNTQMSQFRGQITHYGTNGFLVDFSFNRTTNQKMIQALKDEEWLDGNTRAVSLTWTVQSAWTNAQFIFFVLIENPGNNVFLSTYKIQNIYLSIVKNTSDKQNILAIIIDVLMTANVIIFGGKIIVELSIGINRLTNIVEGVNLTFLLFAIFDGFTLKGLAILDHYNAFTPESQIQYQTFQTPAQLRQLEVLFWGMASFFFPFRVFQFFSHFKFFTPLRIYINTLYRMTPGIILFTLFITMLMFSWSQGLFLVFSPYFYQYRNYFETLNTLCFGLFGQRSEFVKFNSDKNNYLDDGDLEYLGIAGLVINYINLLLLVLFISLVVHLFKKATQFERHYETTMITPDKERLHKEIKQIKEQVNQIYMVKVKGTDNKEAEVQFKNTKIVAWLLNRSQQSLKDEREIFFQRVNEEIKQMTSNLGFMSQGTDTFKGASVNFIDTKQIGGLNPHVQKHPSQQEIHSAKSPFSNIFQNQGQTQQNQPGITLQDQEMIFSQEHSPKEALRNGVNQEHKKQQNNQINSENMVKQTQNTTNKKHHIMHSSTMGSQEDMPMAARSGNMTHEQLHEMLRKRMELMEENKPKQIQFIEFESFKDLIPFLESLFKLKPSLITSFSQDKFRIVIENYTGTIRSTQKRGNTGKGGNSNNIGYQPVKQSDSGVEKGSASSQSEWNLSQAEEIIDYLREMGCKVPVMLYSDMQGEYEEGLKGGAVQGGQLLDPEESFLYFKQLMRLRKKYRLLTTTADINEVKTFCIMNDHISQSLNKQPMLFTSTFYSAGAK